MALTIERPNQQPVPLSHAGYNIWYKDRVIHAWPYKSWADAVIAAQKQFLLLPGTYTIKVAPIAASVPCPHYWIRVPVPTQNRTHKCIYCTEEC